jgi:hypothetical protein
MEETPTSERTKAKIFSTRAQAAAALIGAIAALVTSVGSLIKAGDKSLEKTSYEELSRLIKELQDENKGLRKDVIARALREFVPSSASASAVPSMFVMTPASPSASTNASAPPSAKVVWLSPVVTARPPAAARPLPTASTTGVVAMKDPPEFTTISLKTLDPPPSWDQIRDKSKK